MHARIRFGGVAASVRDQGSGRSIRVGSGLLKQRPLQQPINGAAPPTPHTNACKYADLPPTGTGGGAHHTPAQHSTLTYLQDGPRPALVLLHAWQSPNLQATRWWWWRSLYLLTPRKTSACLPCCVPTWTIDPWPDTDAVARKSPVRLCAEATTGPWEGRFRLQWACKPAG